MQPTQRIMVLDANQRASLAVVRSLGHHNCHIITADGTPSALAGASRYSKLYQQYPSPKTQPDAFIQWLKTAIKRHDISMLIPITEISSQLIVMNKREFANCIIPFANIKTIMTLANKWNLVKLAQQCDIPVPETDHYANSAQLSLTDINEYPVVLKPDVSELWLGDQWLDTVVHIAHNQQELELYLEKPYFKNHSFMVQTFIPGSGAGIFTLYDSGEPQAYFSHQRLREKPPSGGVSVLSEARQPSQALIESSEKLLKAANWHGVAMVEYRVTPEGKAYLMEVNTRFWGSLQLAIDAGIDFPWLLYQISNGETLSSELPIRQGQRLRWLLGDLDHLYIVMKSSKYSLMQKLGKLLTFIALPDGKTKHEVNRLDDLGPALYELKHYFK